MAVALRALLLAYLCAYFGLRRAAPAPGAPVARPCLAVWSTGWSGPTGQVVTEQAGRLGAVEAWRRGGYRRTGCRREVVTNPNTEIGIGTRDVSWHRFCMPGSIGTCPRRGEPHAHMRLPATHSSAAHRLVLLVPCAYCAGACLPCRCPQAACGDDDSDEGEEGESDDEEEVAASEADGSVSMQRSTAAGLGAAGYASGACAL